MKAIEEYLRSWRVGKNFTQEDVAHKLAVSQTTYNNWENGKREIPFKHYAVIAKLMEVKLSEIVPDGVTATVTDNVSKQEVLTLDVKDFLRVSEENNGLLKLRCEQLKAEVDRLTDENNILRAKLNSQ